MDFSMKQQKTFSMSIARQFGIIIAAFLVLTLGITLCSAYSYARILNIQLRNNLQTYAGQLARYTGKAYESYSAICYNVSYNQVVQDFLSTEDRITAYERYTRLERQLNNMAQLNPYIVDIAVYGTNGSFAALRGSRTIYQPFYEDMQDFHFPYHAIDTMLIGGAECHILSVPIYSLDTEPNHCIGVLFLAVDLEQLLSNSMDSQNKSGLFVILTDEKGDLVYGDASLYKALPDAKEENGILRITDARDKSLRHLCVAYDISSIGCRLYAFMEEDQTFSQIKQLFAIFLIGIFLIIAVTFLLLFFLYRPLLSSLRQLTGHMKSFAAGNRRMLTEPVSLKPGPVSFKEVEEISQAFQEMLKEINRLNHTIFDTYTRMYELEANNRRTEIEFLRSQVNPHFLHNTLTMICGMAAEGMTDKIITVTGALSQIFRYSIKGSDLVPLREEMEIVKSYLMIQKERFGDHFSIRYTFLDDSDDCLIPRMIIQPLVENAIVHGIEQALHPCRLMIGAGHNPEHGYLAIWIYDNGVGMPKEKLEQLRAELTHSDGSAPYEEGAQTQKPRSDTHGSIGLKNVNARMILYYGTDYSLLIDSEENVGTNVQIRVPHLTRQEEQYVPGNHN